MRSREASSRTHLARVVVRPERCLNFVHAGRRCDTCARCPARAIDLGPGPAIESERCAGCGRCAASCSAGAFVTPDWKADELLDRCGEARGIELVCPSRPDRHVTRAPGVEAVVEVPCLAGVSVELLIAIAADRGAVWLDDSRCTACALACNGEAIARAAELARRALGAWGRADSIRTYERDTLSLDRMPHVAQDLGDARPRATRRQFLWPFGGAAGPSSAPQPRHRTLLSRALASLGAPPRAAAPLPPERFGRLRVQDSCSACGACAKVCPAGALVAEASPPWFTLEIAPASCLGPGCGLCGLACPERALSFIAADAAWLGAGREVLAKLSVSACEDCHGRIAAQSGDRLCASCRVRRDGRSALLSELSSRSNRNDVTVKSAG